MPPPPAPSGAALGLRQPRALGACSRSRPGRSIVTLIWLPQFSTWSMRRSGRELRHDEESASALAQHVVGQVVVGCGNRRARVYDVQREGRVAHLDGDLDDPGACRTTSPAVRRRSTPPRRRNRSPSFRAVRTRRRASAHPPPRARRPHRASTPAGLPRRLRGSRRRREPARQCRSALRALRGLPRPRTARSASPIAAWPRRSPTRAAPRSTRR